MGQTTGSFPQRASGLGAGASGANFAWQGGEGVFVAVGTFNSTTVKLQVSYDDGTNFVDLSDSAGNAISLGAAGAKTFTCPPCVMRVTTAGGTGTGLAGYVAGSRSRQ